jgi:hypothetical protein
MGAGSLMVGYTMALIYCYPLARAPVDFRGHRLALVIIVVT